MGTSASLSLTPPLTVLLTPGVESAELVPPDFDSSDSMDDDTTPSVSTDFTNLDDDLMVTHPDWNALFATALWNPDAFRLQNVYDDANYSGMSWHGSYSKKHVF
jgi:hypothetical protein